jgi:hypothetical protein
MYAPNELFDVADLSLVWSRQLQMRCDQMHSIVVAAHQTELRVQQEQDVMLRSIPALQFRIRQHPDEVFVPFPSTPLWLHGV